MTLIAILRLHLGHFDLTFIIHLGYTPVKFGSKLIQTQVLLFFTVFFYSYVTFKFQLGHIHALLRLHLGHNQVTLI